MNELVGVGRREAAEQQHTTRLHTTFSKENMRKTQTTRLEALEVIQKRNMAHTHKAEFGIHSSAL